MGALLMESLLLALLTNVLFIPILLQKQFLTSLEIKKPGTLSVHQAFSLVAGVGETSNFELLRDLAKVVDYVNATHI